VLVLIFCFSAISLFYLSENNEIKPGPPEITVLETASDVSIDPNSYVPEYSFVRGQKIWVYMEYINVSHEGSSDFLINLSIAHQDGEQMALVESHVTKDEKACFYFFNTNESWPVGLYTVFSDLTDSISGENANKTTFFDML